MALACRILKLTSLKHLIRRYSVASAQSAISKRPINLRYLDGYDAGIVVIELNKTEGRNSLSNDLVTNMVQVIDEISANNNIRVVLLRSLVPKVFCAGADLKERLAMPESEVGAFVKRLRDMNTKLENMPMPVIAALDGAALGGGLEMALAADIRTAAGNVKLGLVETRLAIIPGSGGTQRLPRLIGPALSKELIFSARVFDGKEAKRLGVVNHVVEQNEESDGAYQKALEIAREILPNGPIGVRMAKLAVNKGLQVDMNTGNMIEETCYEQVIKTEDRIEGLKAFQEKRSPIYTGD